MIRQDYLLRLIEQAAQALAKLLGMQAAGQHPAAAMFSREIAGKWLGLTELQLSQLTDAELVDHLQRNGAIAEFPLRLGLAIALLRAEGARLAETGDRAGASHAKSNALCLLLRAHILNVAPELPDFTPRLADLQAELPFEELPTSTAVLLMCHHEHLGQFGQAEDVLFALRDGHGGVDWLNELGRQFYERLQRRADSELAAGNLPRAEVEEGGRRWMTGAD